jgi:hypothetical protein
MPARKRRSSAATEAARPPRRPTAENLIVNEKVEILGINEGEPPKRKASDCKGTTDERAWSVRK